MQRLTDSALDGAVVISWVCGFAGHGSINCARSAGKTAAAQNWCIRQVF